MFALPVPDVIDVGLNSTKGIISSKLQTFYFHVLKVTFQMFKNK